MEFGVPAHDAFATEPFHVKAGKPVEPETTLVLHTASATTSVCPIVHDVSVKKLIVPLHVPVAVQAPHEPHVPVTALPMSVFVGKSPGHA